MHEDVTIVIYFPLLRHQPWDWYQVHFMGRLVSMMSALHRTESVGGRYILRQFWCARNFIATMT